MISYADEEIDFYLMANLSTRLTGLRFVVWISQRGRAQHDIRVRVSPGPETIPEEMASVALCPTVHVIAGDLSAGDLEKLREWVQLNMEVLVQYWDENLLTDEALAQMKSIK